MKGVVGLAWASAASRPSTPLWYSMRDISSAVVAGIRAVVVAAAVRVRARLVGRRASGDGAHHAISSEGGPCPGRGQRRRGQPGSTAGSAGRRGLGGSSRSSAWTRAAGDGRSGPSLEQGLAGAGELVEPDDSLAFAFELAGLDVVPEVGRGDVPLLEELAGPEVELAVAELHVFLAVEEQDLGSRAVAATGRRGGGISEVIAGVLAEVDRAIEQGPHAVASDGGDGAVGRVVGPGADVAQEEGPGGAGLAGGIDRLRRRTSSPSARRSGRDP